MKIEDLALLAQKIVASAVELKNKHTKESSARVNYVCIFSQNQEEFEAFLVPATEMGTVLENTSTGPLFRIAPLNTVAGPFQFLKIRSPDKTRTERGDADFTVKDYPAFKQTYIDRPGFTLIERRDYEMIELIDPAFDVRAYFSYPSLDQQLGTS